MKFEPIFRTEHNRTWLRFLLLLGFAFWGGCLYWGYEIFTSMGKNPADGYDGQLAPLSHRIGMALTLVLTISGLYFAILFWSRNFVTKIMLSDDESRLRIQTLGLLWNPQLEIPCEDLIAAKLKELDTETGTKSYLRIRIRDRKWSMWLKPSGQILNEQAFDRHVLHQ